MKPVVKKTLKWTFGILGSLVLLVIAAVLFVWCFPETVLTGKRVSGWIAPSVRFERAKDDPYPNSPMVNLEIAKDGFFHRSILVRLAPGCYAPAAEKEGGTEACLEAAEIGISFRLALKRRAIIRLTGLDSLELRASRIRYVAAPAGPKPEEEPANPGSGFHYLRYLDRDFAWGPILIDVARFEMPAAKIVASAKVASAESGHHGKRTSPKLSVEAKAEAPEWVAGVDGEAFQRKRTIVVPKASFTYRVKAKPGSESIALAGELGATYVLTSGDLDATFSVNWKRPTPEIESLRADDGTIRMRADELSAGTNLKILLEGKTPLGRLPLLTVGVAASMRPPDESGNRPFDVDLKIDSYQFAAISVKSDLSVTVIPAKGKNTLKWRKGELRIEVPDFGRTVRTLSHTAWAIPVPFNVFNGPIVFHTLPFVDAADRSTIPAELRTDLKSQEQAFATSTKLEVGLAKKDFGLLGLKVAALLTHVQFRLPDYDPLAPVPALARDSRIVRESPPPPIRTKGKPRKEPKPAPTGTAKGDAANKPVPLDLSIEGSPGSVVLLNRFFDPRLSAGISLGTEPGTDAIKGKIALAAPFDFHYLNRTVRVERITIELHPKIEISALVSMKRGGYRITAELHQQAGKTQISLGSEPPLQESEIVSLLIYGMPGNSISSEQTRSVGSAQAAMSSEALGIFSFFAFASTPIQSVLYDPETQTYSAIVSLPGGVTASIGSNWDNERQLALSKSLGKNWAVSTELIKDSQGVDRGGTLLRWRKTY